MTWQEIAVAVRQLKEEQTRLVDLGYKLYITPSGFQWLAPPVYVGDKNITVKLEVERDA
jgi:hypothetical protein